MPKIFDYFERQILFFINYQLCEHLIAKSFISSRAVIVSDYIKQTFEGPEGELFFSTTKSPQNRLC